MLILFHTSSSHPPLTTTSSSLRVRNKGKVKVELEQKGKKKPRYLVLLFFGVGPQVLDDLTPPCIASLFSHRAL